MQSLETVLIEELTDLREELKSLRHVEQFQEFLELEKLTFMNDISKISASTIKGWLFQFYTQVNDIESYERINDNALLYKKSDKRLFGRRYSNEKKNCN